MKCPVDDSVLVMSDRNGVEIDYCPTCRGVWLDRGELDKIIDRMSGMAPEARPQPPQSHHESQPMPPQNYHHKNRDSDDDYYHNNHDSHKKRKREGFLGDLFDF